MQIVIVMLIVAIGIIFLMPASSKKSENDDYVSVDDLTSPELEDMLDTEDCPQELIENEIIHLRMVQSIQEQKGR